MTMTTAPSYTITNVETVDLGKAKNSISTGIGFLDHMLDQLNSHAQIGVAIHVHANADADADNNVNADADAHADDNANTHLGNNQDIINRHANVNQSELLSLIGQHLGLSLRTLLQSKKIQNATSRFCCPLDEALVECTLVLPLTNEENNDTPKSCISLSPYGIYGPHGRTKIGQLQTNAIPCLFHALAQHSGLNITLTKLRGDNGHHIVESAFKAFSRALRNLLDGQNVDHVTNLFTLLQSDLQTPIRTAKVERSTKETSILVQIALDHGATGIHVQTGMDILNNILSTLAQHAKLSLTCQCKGDLFVDDHHSTEDVGIALGTVLNTALGTKAGLNRMWCAREKVNDALVEVTMDLSNRPCFTQNLSLYDDEYVAQTLTTEMFHHFFESLTMNAHMTVHILQVEAGTSVEDRALATAAAFGKALQFCAAVDPRRAGATASSKGTLSV